MTNESPYSVGTLIRFRKVEATIKDIGYIQSIMPSPFDGYFYNIKMFSDGYVFKKVHQSLLTTEELLG